MVLSDMHLKKQKFVFLAVALVSVVINLSFTPLQSICGDQLKDIAVIPYISGQYLH
jgi:hypothetical protein